MPKQRIPKADTEPAPPDASPADAADVEGHNLWINPAASREMTNSRNRDIERQVRERQREKEARKQR